MNCSQSHLSMTGVGRILPLSTGQGIQVALAPITPNQLGHLEDLEYRQCGEVTHGVAVIIKVLLDSYFF